MTEALNRKDHEPTEEKNCSPTSRGEENFDKTGEIEEETQVKEENGEEKPAVRLEQLEKEKEELYQRYLRLKADFANYRRRSLEDQQRLRRQAVEETILKILPVLDNLERAVGSPGEKRSLLTGVEMVVRQFQGILKEEGIVPIAALGEAFDPSKHEAFSREEAEEPENTILEELQKGYLFGEKTLRPSLVKVAAGRLKKAGKKEQQETTE